MSMPTSTVVGLDRTGDVWVGTFPGLGTVRVGADGHIAAEAEPGQGPDADETTEQRHAALVHGWGEPLALARQGYHVAHGAALVPPADGADGAGGADGRAPAALLVSGDLHDTAIVVLGLAARGWQVLADRLTPLTWPSDDSAPVAYPRHAPVVASARRAQRAELAATPARADSDAVTVDVARATQPHSLGGIVSVRIRRPHDPLLDQLRGHRRVETAQGLIAGGALAAESDGATPSAHAHDGGLEVAAQSMAHTLRLAALPLAAVHLDPADPTPALDALVAWWADR
jgi:hypothetical protein